MVPAELHFADVKTLYVATGANTSGTLVAAKTGHRIAVLSLTVAAGAAAFITCALGSTGIADTGWFQGVAANKLFQQVGLTVGASGDALAYTANTPSTGGWIVCTYAYFPG